MDTKPTIETVLERINALSERMDNRIDALSEHMDTRFNLAEARLHRVETRLDRLQGGMLDLRGRFGELHADIKKLVPALQDAPQDLLDG